MLKDVNKVSRRLTVSFFMPLLQLELRTFFQEEPVITLTRTVQENGLKNFFFFGRLKYAVDGLQLCLYHSSDNFAAKVISSTFQVVTFPMSHRSTIHDTADDFGINGSV